MTYSMLQSSQEIPKPEFKFKSFLHKVEDMFYYVALYDRREAYAFKSQVLYKYLAHLKKKTI